MCLVSRGITPSLNKDELGSTQEGRRWVTHPTYPRVGHSEESPTLGIGLMPMKEHIKALQAIWIIRYLTPSTADWKIALDQWFNRTPLGRGAVLSTISIHRLTDSIGGNNSLPNFWKAALTNFRNLKLDKNVETGGGDGGGGDGGGVGCTSRLGEESAHAQLRQLPPPPPWRPGPGGRAQVLAWMSNHY